MPLHVKIQPLIANIGLFIVVSSVPKMTCTAAKARKLASRDKPATSGRCGSVKGSGTAPVGSHLNMRRGY